MPVLFQIRSLLNVTATLTSPEKQRKITQRLTIFG